MLEQPGIATIYPNGPNSGVSSSKMCFFSIDEIYYYYLQVWECLSKTDTFKLAEPDLVRVRYQNMRIFPGNFIHGEGFRDEILTGNVRIPLMIIDRNIRVSKCICFLQ